MKNEGLCDRISRAILGVGFFILGYFYFNNGWQYVFYFVGLVLLVTSITGYCGVYKLFKISTLKKKKKEKKFICAKEETEM